MRTPVIITVIIVIALLGTLDAEAQEPSLQERVDAAIEACTSLPSKSRVETVGCVNEGMTQTYESANWPYMDTVYQFESTILTAAAQADAGKISQAEFGAAIKSADLQMRAEVSKRAQERTAAARQQLEQEDQQEAAQEQANRRALIGAFIQGGGFSRPAPTPFYPVPITPQTNCTTSYVGNRAYTHCQ